MHQGKRKEKVCGGGRPTPLPPSFSFFFLPSLGSKVEEPEGREGGWAGSRVRVEMEMVLRDLSLSLSLSLSLYMQFFTLFFIHREQS